MSVLRTAALRLAVNKAPAAVARRYASSALALPEEFQQFTLKDPRIPEGVKALELPVPSSLPKNDFVERRHAVEDHSEGSTDLWRKVSWYVALPAIIVSSIYVYQLEKEHEEHLAHAIEENGGVPPERKVYSYMNMRAKPFPWGNQALLYNERYNIGIEEEA